VTDPSFDDSYLPPRRVDRRSVIAWLVLLLVVIGAVATLLTWVSHRLSGIAQ
jgi:hypothetical protein